MRSLGLALCLLIPTVLLAVGPAAAQLPGELDCRVELSAADQQNPSASGFQANQERTYRFDLTNPSVAEADATFNILTSPRPGWFWSTQDRPVTVPAQGSTSVNVSVLFEGTQAGDAQLEVQVTDVNCGPTGVPGTDSGTVSLTLSHASDAVAGPGPSDGGDDGIDTAWWVFGAIVLGTAIAVPVVYTRRGPSLDVSCEEAESEVVAGRGTSFPVKLKNKASEPVHVDLEVADVQKGWSALTTLPDLELAGKESRTIYLMVRAPAEAKPGDLCVAKLAVTPEGGSTKTVKTLTRVDQGSGGSDEPEAEPPSEPATDEEPEDQD